MGQVREQRRVVTGLAPLVAPVDRPGLVQNNRLLQPSDQHVGHKSPAAAADGCLRLFAGLAAGDLTACMVPVLCSLAELFGATTDSH